MAVGLLLYFGLHVLLRLWTRSAVELDEAELLVLGQEWRLGYGSQPPLYVWLQRAFFAVFGCNILALVLLKSLLLWTLFFLVFRTVRSLSGQERPALVAMFSLFLIPQIAWEGQRDLSHTLTVVTCTVATYWVGWRALQSGRAQEYLALGSIAALGLLSKYNYALFLAQFMLATLSLSEGRRGLRTKWIWLSLSVLLLLVGPHFWWNLGHPAELLAQAGKLQIDQSRAWGTVLLEASSRIVRLLAGFLPLLLGVYWTVFGNIFRAPEFGKVTPLAGRWMGRMVLVGVILCVGVALLWPLGLRQRWLLPVLICIPLAWSMKAEFKMSPARLRAFSIVTLLLGLGYLAVLPLRPWLPARLGQVSKLNVPYAELASRLQEAGFREGVIAAEDRHVGGNLKLFFPSSRVIVPELVELTLPKQIDGIMVWDARHERNEPPAQLLALIRARGFFFPETSDARFVEAPFTHLPAATMRLGFIRIQAHGH